MYLLTFKKKIQICFAQFLEISFLFHFIELKKGEQGAAVESVTPEEASNTIEGAAANANVNETGEGTSSTAQIDGTQIPDGIDPSFLAALPEEMRAEVIAEHLRIQRMQERTRLQQQVAVQNEQQAVAEVNPEFLAALPPSIQEEVLAQQRLEQQRLAAAAANPNDPVDAAAFFQNLQPSLRYVFIHSNYSSSFRISFDEQMFSKLTNNIFIVLFLNLDKRF